METTDAAEGTDESDRPLPEYVDWLVAAAVALGGLALTVGGVVLTLLADRDLLAEGIESGEITVAVFERDLTVAQQVAFATDVLDWTGIGLLVTGVGLLLFAVGFAVARRRAHRRTGPGDRVETYRSNAVYGAVATAVLSFLPFSPVAGGALAGYLEHRWSDRSLGVGALSGVLVAVPTLLVLLFVTVGMYAGLSSIDETGLGTVTAATMLFVGLFVVALTAGLGALGGLVGGRIAADDV
jgi:hypothetical protein